MEFRKNILLILMQCIDDSSVKFRQTDENWDTILKRISNTRMEELNEVVRVIDSANNAIEGLYSCKKFIEILDDKGFGGLVK